MSETESDEGAYEYFCVDCKELVNPQDKVCANCGADISEFIEPEAISSEIKFPACPLCKGRSFQREEGRLDSMWGFSSHVMTLMICEQCQYVLQFYDGNSIWDFD